MDEYFELYRGYVNALKTRDRDSIEREKELLDNNPEIENDMDTYQFILILLTEPFVYMELLSTLVSMQLFGPKITQSIKNEFKNLNYQDTVEVCSGSSPFILTNGDEVTQKLTDKMKRVGKTYYNLLVKDWSKETPEDINVLIEALVNIANGILGDNAGNKALVAAQTGVWTAAAAIQAYSKGCKVEGSGASTELCAEADKLLHDLTTASPNVDLQ